MKTLNKLLNQMKLLIIFLTLLLCSCSNESNTKKIEKMYRQYKGDILKYKTISHTWGFLSTESLANTLQFPGLYNRSIVDI